MRNKRTVSLGFDIQTYVIDYGGFLLPEDGGWVGKLRVLQLIQQGNITREYAEYEYEMICI